MKMKHLIVMIFICFQTNCSNKHFDAQKNNLGYKKGNQKIVLEILNDNNYLQLGTKEKIKVKCENIKTEKLSFSGKGISFYKSDKDLQNELILNINLNNEEIKVLKNYELVMSYYDGDNSFVHKFTIPIKDK
jgi:hypothetical protein